MVDLFGFGSDSEEEENVELIDVSVVQELVIDQDMFLNLEQGASVRFNFEKSTADSKLLLKVWERGLRASFADIDIYMNVDNEEGLSETNFTWKLKWGSMNVEILPDD